MADETDELHPLAQAAIDAHDALAPKIADAKRAHIVDLLEQFETDIAPLVAPFVQTIVDDPEVPEHVRALLAPLTAPEHFGESVVIGIAVGSIIAPVLQSALDPLLVELGKGAWRAAIGSAGALGGLPLSPEVLATAVLKGVLSKANAESQAIQSGHTQSSFDVMVQAAGQSIGLAEALLLYRRGQIDLAHLQRIMQYSNLNPLFYADVPKLQYGPPPAGEVVAGLLKGHLTAADAAVKLGHAGINPAELGWMRATAGRPPSPAEMVRLWHRNQATELDVDHAVRQSDINDDFLPFVKLLGHWYPPPRSIMAMLRDGSIDDARGRQLFTFAGVPADIATDMIGEAHHSKGAQVKQLSSAQVIRMYSARLYDRATASAKLTALRYTPADVTLLLDFADDERTERLLAATIHKVGTLYVAHKVNRTDAAAALNTAGVAVAAQHDLFTLWDIQRGANVHLPSPAMIVGAYRRGDIPALECKNRLLAAGIQPGDLDIFVADGWPPTKGAEARAAAAAVVAA